MAKKTADPVQSIRERLRQAAGASGLTQEEIGVKMGLTEKDARKAVSRLLNPGITYDPRLSTLLKFADAIEKKLSDLI
ncbi:MAG: helix-turn-helix transcriptional regulator [Planctomycetes bacterium]|nr:helix-turn-helix transcriptional regulator [Planctomycetota bacterium]